MWQLIGFQQEANRRQKDKCSTFKHDWKDMEIAMSDAQTDWENGKISMPSDWLGTGSKTFVGRDRLTGFRHMLPIPVNQCWKTSPCIIISGVSLYQYWFLLPNRISCWSE